MKTRESSVFLPELRRNTRWFELDCLLEQAEFELPCGLSAALRPTMAGLRISALRAGRITVPAGRQQGGGTARANPNLRRCSFQSNGKVFTFLSVNCAGRRPCKT